jgi:hypothetical protein
LQESGALATLSGILAGFAVSVVVQFLASEREGRLYSAAIVVFSVATLMFLFSLIMFILGFAGAAVLGRVPRKLDPWGISALLVLLAGVYLFLGGIGLAGWIRSKTAGIVTSASALVTICLTTWGLGAVIALFTK